MTDTSLGNVLIVDDDPRNRKLLETLLTAEGYAVHCCDSGAAALEAIADFMPDAVVLDVMMPRMDGFELIRRLKAEPYTRGLPLLVVTALDDEASRRRLATAGVEDVLPKPIDRWQLKARLAELVKSGGAHDE